MARLTGPLQSGSAQKQLAHSLIFKMKGGKAFATRYNKPGGKNPFTPSASQTSHRDSYYMALEIWRAFDDEEREYWDDIAKATGRNISGWNLFCGEVIKSPEDFCAVSTYGEACYGYKLYGKSKKAKE